LISDSTVVLSKLWSTVTLSALGSSEATTASNSVTLKLASASPVNLMVCVTVSSTTAVELVVEKGTVVVIASDVVVEVMAVVVVEDVDVLVDVDVDVLVDVDVDVDVLVDVDVDVDVDVTDEVLEKKELTMKKESVRVSNDKLMPSGRSKVKSSCWVSTSCLSLRRTCEPAAAPSSVMLASKVDERRNTWRASVSSMLRTLTRWRRSCCRKGMELKPTVSK